MESKTLQQIKEMAPETQQAIKSIAESIKPMLKELHSHPATTQNYYGDYMRILSYAAKQSEAKIKLLAIAMLYAGANVYGIEAAVKNII